MRFAAVLNRNGGTMKSVDIGEYHDFLHQTFEANGHTLSCEIVEGPEIEEKLSEALSDTKSDAVLAAGGDGTISCAGALAWKHGKPLGVIPAGRMNMFARALNIPLEIRQAAEALAAGAPASCDIATANGRPYLYQYSVGLHPHVIRSRERYDYQSRLGKMRASLMAIFDAMRRPPSFPVDFLTGDGQLRKVVSSIAVSNNPYGEGHLPHADDVTSGQLGIYIADPIRRGEGARMLTDMALGTWRNNPSIEEKRVKQVTLSFPRLRRDAKAVIDGELIDLEEEVELKIHPGALKVIVPKLQDGQT